MRGIDRYGLVQQIALHLQASMNTSGINVYLGGFDVEHDRVSIVPSKRGYVEKLLSDASDRTILQIADDLRIATPNRASLGARQLQEYLKAGELAAAHDDFERALHTVESDPSQAIASASSTLESICKSLLDAGNIEYPADESLQPLVKTVCGYLNLSPDSQADPDIKRVLGGLQNAAFGIAVLRTKFSAAHGKGVKQFRWRLGPRHARMAVNAAATVGYFLIETYQERNSGRQ